MQERRGSLPGSGGVRVGTLTRGRTWRTPRVSGACGGAGQAACWRAVGWAVSRRRGLPAGPALPEMEGQQEGAVITPAMLEEEQQLEAAGLERERKMLEKVTWGESGSRPGEWVGPCLAWKRLGASGQQRGRPVALGIHPAGAGQASRAGPAVGPAK